MLKGSSTCAAHTWAADIPCSLVIASSFETFSSISHILLCHSLTPLGHPDSQSIKRADWLRSPWEIRTDCCGVWETEHWDPTVKIGAVQLPGEEGLDIRSDSTIWDWSVFTQLHLFLPGEKTTSLCVCVSKNNNSCDTMTNCFWICSS